MNIADATTAEELVEAIKSTLTDQREELLAKSDELVAAYVQWVLGLSDCSSMSELDLLVKEQPECLKTNDCVQYFLALERKGLVHTSPGENARDYIDHPIIRQLSRKKVTQMLANPAAFTMDQSNAVDEMIYGIAAARVLGEIEYIATPEMILHTDIALIPDLGETLH